jgi:hypothetical protein
MNPEIFLAVADLNEELYDNGWQNDEISFSVKTDMFAGKVTFMGCDIWTVDTDTREYNEETNTYESYGDCFRREAISVIGNLDAVKQILNQGT